MMFEDVLNRVKRRKKSNCLTLMRNNCEIIEKHVIIKRKSQNVVDSEKTELSHYFNNIKGLNVRERTGLIFFTRVR